MIDWIKAYFIEQGISEVVSGFMSATAAVIITVLVSFLSYYIAKKLLLRIMKAVVSKSKAKWDDILFRRKVFDRLILIIPAIVVNIFASTFPSCEVWIRRIALSMIVFGIILSLDKLLDAVDDIYRNYEISKSRPIKGYLQIVKILAYIIGAVVIISVLMDQSPTLLLGGIGAATAVILLIFQNSILGFVASIQLTENDMVRIGDWIEMPSRSADGSVIDVTLHTVKVQNWDKTITTIPTYSLVSESFKNWRSMQEAGGRRIERALYIDMTSIKFCDDEMLARYSKFRLIEDYLAKKTKEIDAYNKQLAIDSSRVDGRHLTNIGTFRAYVDAYLAHNPKVHKSMTRMVRQLSPTEHGLPLEIYVFTNTTEWAEYEGIQADIFDHIIAVAAEFDLRIFQNPTGHDLSEVRKTFTN